MLGWVNPAITHKVWPFDADLLLAAFEGYGRPGTPAAARLAKQLPELVRAYATRGRTHEAGWGTVAMLRPGTPEGAAIGAVPLGLLFFQPQSAGVVFGHQVSLCFSAFGHLPDATAQWGRAEVRRVLYLAGFERLEYLSWATTLSGCYVVQQGKPEGGWMVRSHNGFAVRQAASDAVDLPICLHRDASEVVRYVRVPGVTVDVRDWDEPTRRHAAGVVNAIRCPLYRAAMELDRPLQSAPTPFEVSTAERSGWRQARNYRVNGPSRARRALVARLDGVEVGLGILDAVDWPVNVSGLMDAVRLYPIGSVGRDVRKWRRVRWALLGAAARWFWSAGVERFAYLNEPVRRIVAPESAHGGARLPVALAPPPLGAPAKGATGMLDRPLDGRFWVLRRQPAAGPPAHGPMTLFSRFAAFAEAQTQAEISSLVP